MFTRRLFSDSDSTAFGESKLTRISLSATPDSFDVSKLDLTEQIDSNQPAPEDQKPLPDSLDTDALDDTTGTRTEGAQEEVGAQVTSATETAATSGEPVPPNLGDARQVLDDLSTFAQKTSRGFDRGSLGRNASEFVRDAAGKGSDALADFQGFIDRSAQTPEPTETDTTPVAEERKPETPVAEERKPETPVAEERKPETPVAEERKPETPVAEERKPETPVAEERKPETPVAEEDGEGATTEAFDAFLRDQMDDVAGRNDGEGNDAETGNEEGTDDTAVTDEGTDAGVEGDAGDTGAEGNGASVEDFDAFLKKLDDNGDTGPEPSSDAGVDDSAATDDADEGVDDSAATDDTTDEGVDDSAATDDSDDGVDDSAATDDSDDGVDDSAATDDSDDGVDDSAATDDSDDGVDDSAATDDSDDGVDDSAATDDSDDGVDDSAATDDSVDNGNDASTENPEKMPKKFEDDLSALRQADNPEKLLAALKGLQEEFNAWDEGFVGEGNFPTNESVADMKNAIADAAIAIVGDKAVITVIDASNPNSKLTFEINGTQFVDGNLADLVQKPLPNVQSGTPTGTPTETGGTKPSEAGATNPEKMPKKFEDDLTALRGAKDAASLTTALQGLQTEFNAWNEKFAGEGNFPDKKSVADMKKAIAETAKAIVGTKAEITIKDADNPNSTLEFKVKGAEAANAPKSDLDKNISAAQDILNNPKASNAERFAAAVTLLLLALEKAGGGDGGATAGAEKPAAPAVEGTGSEKTKEKSESGKDKKEGGTETQSARRERLKTELKDSDGVTDLIGDKQKKLDERIGEIDGEINGLEDEIDVFEKEQDGLQIKQDDLEENVADMEQELSSMDAKGDTSPEAQARRKELKSGIDKAKMKIDDIKADQKALDDKIDRRDDRIKKLENEKKGSDVTALRDDIKALNEMRDGAKEKVKAMNELLDLSIKELESQVPSLKGLREAITVDYDPKTLETRVNINAEFVTKIEAFAKEKGVALDLSSAVKDGKVTDIAAFAKALQPLNGIKLEDPKA